MSQNYTWPAQSITATNPSVGVTGTPAPTSATEVAGVTTGGTLVPVQVTSSGAVVTTQAAGTFDNVNIAEYGGTATTLGQKASAASIPVVIASDQSAIPISAASLPLPTGASTSANQVTQETTLTTIQANQTNGTQTTVVTQPNPTLLNSTAFQPTATNLNATVVQGTSPWVTTATVSGTVTANQGTPNTVGNAWPVEITNGTSVAGVAPGSTAATAIEPAAVVALSPNSPLPAGTNNIGSITDITGTVSLPTGASTAANQATEIADLGTIIANQTNGTQRSQAATPTPLTITQAAIAVGLTAVRLTVSGAAPAATRVLLVGSPSPGTVSTVNFFIGSASVTSTGATRGPSIQFGQSFIANSDAGDYWVCSDTAGQTIDVMEQS